MIIFIGQLKIHHLPNFLSDRLKKGLFPFNSLVFSINYFLESIKSPMSKREPVVCKDGLCSFNSTGKNYYPQHWYHCETCFPLYPNKGCCDACAAVCHKGHQLEEGKTQYFFCDCGAGDCRFRCQCLTKPKPILQTNSHIDEEKKAVTQRINQIIDDLFQSPVQEPQPPEKQAEEIQIQPDSNSSNISENQSKVEPTDFNDHITKEETISFKTDETIKTEIQIDQKSPPPIESTIRHSKTSTSMIQLNNSIKTRSLLPRCHQSQTQLIDIMKIHDSDKSPMRSPQIRRPSTKMKRIIRNKNQEKARFHLYV